MRPPKPDAASKPEENNSSSTVMDITQEVSSNAEIDASIAENFVIPAAQVAGMETEQEIAIETMDVSPNEHANEADEEGEVAEMDTTNEFAESKALDVVVVDENDVENDLHEAGEVLENIS